MLGFEHARSVDAPHILTYEMRVGAGIKVEFSIHDFLGSDSEGQAFGSDRGQVLDIPIKKKRLMRMHQPQYFFG